MASAKPSLGPLRGPGTTPKGAGGAPRPAPAAAAPSPSSSSSSSSSRKAVAIASPSSSRAALAASPKTPKGPMLMSPNQQQQSLMHRQKEAKSPSAPSRSSARKLLAERSEQNKKDLPLNVKMMLQKQPEMWSDPSLMQSYPDEVWAHYDVNRDGILNKSELLALSKDLVDRVVSMCRAMLKAQMPKASDKDLDKMLKKEQAHILPAKTIEESRRVVAEIIFRELDIDKDGVITRTEFFFAWQGCSQKILDVNKQKQESLSCAIL